MKRAIWLLVGVLESLGCATYGPTPEQRRIDAQFLEIERQEHESIEAHAIWLRSQLRDVDKVYSEHCSGGTQRSAIEIDTCSDIMVIRWRLNNEIALSAAQHRDIDLRRVTREQEDQRRAYEDDRERRRQIQQAFQPPRQINCKSEQWGKDIRTTCD